MDINIFFNELLEKQPNLPHYHNSIELIRVLDGRLHCLIEGKEYTITKDYLCIINQNNIHKMYSAKECNCNFQRVMIDPYLFISNKDMYNKYLKPILLNKGFSKVILLSKSVFAREIVNFIDLISDIKTRRNEAYEFDIFAIIHMILKNIYMIYKSATGEFYVPIDTDSSLYRKMIEFIYKNYHNKLSLDDIANSGSISRSKCCIIFKKYAQNSPIKFLNLYRMEISVSLLKNTNDSISSIALNCGFGQQSYYNRLFFKKYGMTPKEYRKSVNLL